MQKFNDSSLVSACLNFNPEFETQRRPQLQHNHHHHQDRQQIDHHFDSLKREMYMSQYRLDFKAPKRAPNIERIAQPQTTKPEIVNTSQTVFGCRCSKCLGKTFFSA